MLCRFQGFGRGLWGGLLCRSERASAVVLSQVLTTKLLERSPQDEIQRAFTLFDLQQTGRITAKELSLIARQLQVCNCSQQQVHIMSSCSTVSSSWQHTSDSKQCSQSSCLCSNTPCTGHRAVHTPAPTLRLQCASQQPVAGCHEWLCTIMGSSLCCHVFTADDPLRSTHYQQHCSLAAGIATQHL